jgi:hypothetical protein
MKLTRQQKRQMIRHLNKPSTILDIAERMEISEQKINNARRMELLTTKNYLILVSIIAIIGGIFFLYAL